MSGRKKRRQTRSGRERSGSTPWAGLHAEYYPQIRSWFAARVASQQDADDLAQEVFAQLADADPPDDPRAYLTGIASRVLSRHRRQRARARAVLRRLLAEAMSDAGAQPRDEDSLSAKDNEMVEELLGELPRADVKLLRLRFVEGLRIREIAPRVGCSTEAAYKRLQRILKQLRPRYGIEPTPTRKPQEQ
jgi:RNA polymerase sigma factor (sigma-70 family)